MVRRIQRSMERQSAASQHEVLRPAGRVGQPVPDRRGIYSHRGVGSVSQGVLGLRASCDAGEGTGVARGV